MTTTTAERENQPTICIKKITRNEKKKERRATTLQQHEDTCTGSMFVYFVYQPRKATSKSKRNTQKINNTSASCWCWCGKEATLDAAPPPPHEYSGRRHVTFNCDLFICTCLAQSCGACLCWCAGQTMARAVQKRQPPSEDGGEDDAYFVWWILLIKSR